MKRKLDHGQVCRCGYGKFKTFIKTRGVRKLVTCRKCNAIADSLENPLVRR